MEFTAILPQSRDDFHIAVFCALPHEAEKVTALFDKDWRKEGRRFGKDRNDLNTYSLGTIGMHNVVVVHLAGMGGIDASAAASNVNRSFANIRFAFVVGLCGIVPRGNWGTDIVLGDCIVSTAIIPYRFGEQHEHKFERRRNVEDCPGRADRETRSFLQFLRSRGDLSDELVKNLTLLQEKIHGSAYPGQDKDRLFSSDYVHKHHQEPESRCDACDKQSGTCSKTCEELQCDPDKIQRSWKSRTSPKIHFGRVGSADTVMKSAQQRDKVAAEDNLIAFEMEGFGVWDCYRTILVKGGCDYADSHKDYIWHEYASTVAASGFKTILNLLDPEEPVALLVQNSGTVHTSLAAGTLSGAMRGTPHYVQQPLHGQRGSLERSSTPRGRVGATVCEPTRSRAAELPAPSMSAVPLEQTLAELRSHTPVNPELRRCVNDLITKSHLLDEGVDYWSHLTVAGQQTYGYVYNLLSSNTGYATAAQDIDIHQFFNCFGNLSPEPKVVIGIWQRFGPVEQTSLTKSYTQALLYMIHVEYYCSRFRVEGPRLEPSGQLSKDRLKILASFAEWVDCSCPNRCGLKWNFAGKRWGMLYGPDSVVANMCPVYKYYIERERNKLAVPDQKVFSQISKEEEVSFRKEWQNCKDAWIGRGQTHDCRFHPPS